MEPQIHHRAKKGKTKHVPPPTAQIQDLSELQEFLTEELVDQGTAYRRAFIPLTEGLGLESPKSVTPKIKLDQDKHEKLTSSKLPLKSEASPVHTLEAQILQDVIEPIQEQKTPPPLKSEVRVSENRLAEVMDPPSLPGQPQFFEAPPQPPKLEVASASEKYPNTQPPPLPRPSVFKRLLAGVIDHVFVLLIWTAMIVLTSNLMNDFSSGFSIQILADFGQAKFQRMAVLEFAAAWFGYLGFCLLISKRTFGMWVWSIGVSYGDKLEENYTMRKAMRIFWTFLFSAPIVPSLFLIVHKNGRNILDVLSGTNVYDSN